MSSPRELLEVLLTNLQSPNNEVRSQAEQILQTEWVSGAPKLRSALLLGLAEIATQGPVNGRPFAAILLRRYSTKIMQDTPGMERVIDTVPQETRVHLRSMLLQAFTEEQTRDTRHKLADAIAEVARGTGEGSSEAWPDLLSTLFQATKSPNADIREGVFRIFAAVPELIADREDVIQGTISVLDSGFNDENELVRISAVSAFSAFFERLPKSTWKLFRPLLPSLLSVAEPLRQRGSSSELTAVFESLIDLAGMAPKMFQQVFSEVIAFAIAVMQDKNLDEAARTSALEFATTFADEAPNMCKSDPDYAEKMIQQCLAMLLEVGENDDENASEWNNEDDTTALEDEEEIHNAAKSSIDRLSLRLEGPVIVPPLSRWLPSLATSEDWRGRHAALMAISNAAEGCRDVMITDIGQILDMVIPRLDDPHTRVQWAACNALGQISTDLADNVQRRHHQRVLPALINKLSNQSTFRVQAHAAAAIFNFSENASKEILAPYLDDMLSRLLEVLHGPKRYVQEQVLATIAIVADAAKSQFVKYYDVLMPMMINFLKSDTGSEDRGVKAKAIECSTLIAVAVGKEKFEPNLKELIEIFSSIQSHSPPDDPCQQYLTQAWARICRVLGTEFLPYLGEVMPTVLMLAKSKADYQILDEEQASAIDGHDGWEVYQTSGQFVGVHTAGFEDKATAIELLTIYASELGADFFPYVEDIVENIVIPGMTFYYFDPVRDQVFQLIPHLIAAAQDAAVRQSGGNLAARAAPDVLKIWSVLLQKMLTLLAPNDESVAMVAEMFNTITSSMERIGVAAIPPAVVTPLMAALVQVMDSLDKRVEQRENELNDEFIEEVEEEDAEADDQELIESSNRLIHSLFKVLKSEYLASFEQIIPVLRKFISSSSEDSVEWALFVVGDLIEYTGAAAWKYHEVFGSEMLSFLVHSNSRIRQVAAYDIGVAAQHGGAPFAEATVRSLESLFNIVSSPDSRSDENIGATESAIAAIAKILRAHGQVLGGQLDMALTEWIKILPVLEDIESASYSYSFLVELMGQKHSAVTSQIQKVFNSIAEALVARATSTRVHDRLVVATKELLSNIPQDQAMALLQGLAPEDQQAIQAIFQ